VASEIPANESLTRVQLLNRQRTKFAALLDVIRPSNRFYTAKLAAMYSHAAENLLEGIPFTTRAEIEADQFNNPPYGTNLSFPLSRYHRLHQTSGTTGGPMRWLDTPESWKWFLECWQIVFGAAGTKPQDRIIFPFSFGPFIGFWGAFEAASSMGNLSLPAGGMTTAARLRFLLDNEATIVCCTPTYALRLAEVAAAEAIDLANSPVRLIIVAGEPGGSIGPVRARIESAFGARVIDHVGMTEIGAYGVECVENPGGMHVIETEFIAEVIDESTRPVSTGSIGELVLTNLGRSGSPLIRYRTGDLVRATLDACPCGRCWTRLEGGILGRVDEMLQIRGNNVFPTAVEAIIREFSQVTEFRLSVLDHGGMNELRIEIECNPSSSASADQSVAQTLAYTIRDRLHFRPEIAVVPPGSLPRFEMKAQRVVRIPTRTP